jgi:hypothetical protein
MIMKRIVDFSRSGVGALAELNIRCERFQVVLLYHHVERGKQESTRLGEFRRD